MRWEGQRESENVEDRRGQRPVGRGLAMGGGGLLFVLIVSVLTGQNPLQILNMIGSLQEGAPPSAVESPAPTGPPSDTLGKFASVVLADTEDTWNAILARQGRTYERPRLVLFHEAVQSACGMSVCADPTRSSALAQRDERNCLLGTRDRLRLTAT